MLVSQTDLYQAIVDLLVGLFDSVQQCLARPQWYIAGCVVVTNFCWWRTDEACFVDIALADLASIDVCMIFDDGLGCILVTERVSLTDG